MELIKGGSLNLYIKRHKGFSEDITRFIIA